jgi:uncharacterized protein (DUF1800 family)
MEQVASAVLVPERLKDTVSAPRAKEQAAYRREHKGAKPPEAAATAHRKRQVRYYLRDAHNRMAAAVESPSPFVERLVAFWSNHFSISRRAGPGTILMGPYEAEAIRPHIRGRFVDMLLAVEQHPAMFLYLDQNLSLGPNSPQGRKSGKGINENLAREILELHTLGVHGGYDQADVTAFANIMTGWFVNFASGGVDYTPQRAEPGPKKLLGRTFGPEPSPEDYIEALKFIATHPATALHVARKLVTHFIADDPPPAAVEAVEAAFKRSDGHLPAVYEALLALPEARRRPGAKARMDFDFVVSALRTAEVPIKLLEFPETGPPFNPLTVGALAKMSQPLWNAPSPAGWPEDAKEWLSPVGLAQRLNYIPKVVHHVKDADARGFLERVLGPLASESTRDIVKVASNREEGIALVFASPEFNRR